MTSVRRCDVWFMYVLFLRIIIIYCIGSSTFPSCLSFCEVLNSITYPNRKPFDYKKQFGMMKLESCYCFHAFTCVIGALFLVSLGCDCFSLAPAFVGDKRIFRQSIPLSRQCADSRRTISSAIASSENDENCDSKSLLEFLSPVSSCSVNQMSGTDLAYIGDVVFELFVRSRHVWPSKRTSDLQDIAVGLVRGTSFEQFIYSELLLRFWFVTTGMQTRWRFELL